MKALVTLIEATVYDPATSTMKTIRVCNRNEPRATTWNNLAWLPILAKSPAVGASVFNGDFTGFGENTVDEFQVSADESTLEPFMDYNWHGATVKIFAGDLTTCDIRLIFTAVGQGISRNGNVSVTVNLATLNYKLQERQLLYSAYLGTGDIEGTSDIEGVLKPMVFGDAKYCRPVLVDEVRQIYQVHGYGPVESIYGVFEGGLTLGAVAGSQTGTYAAFRDTAVTQGTWIRHNNLGLIKLGSQPTFPITCHVKGDANGVAGGTCLKKAADIVKRMVTMNVTGVSLSNASIAALNTAAPQSLDFYFEDQVGILDAVAMTLRSVGGYWLWNEKGLMIFGRMRFSASPSKTRVSPELLVNGNFASDLSSWTKTGTGTAVIANGQLRMTEGGGAGVVYLDQTIQTVVGKTYRIEVQIDENANPSGLHISGDGAVWSINAETRSGLFVADFVAPNPTCIIEIHSPSFSGSGLIAIDWISVKERADLVLSAANDQGPADVLNISQLPTGSPVWSLRLGANACHFVHDASSIVQSLIDLKESQSTVTRDALVVSVNYVDDADLLKEWLIRDGSGVRSYGIDIDGVGGGYFASTGPGGAPYTLGPELLTNGDFNAGTTGWTAVVGTITNPSWNGSPVLRLSTTKALGYAYRQVTGLEIGATYQITYSDRDSGVASNAKVKVAQQADNTGNMFTSSYTLTDQLETFVATSVTAYVRLDQVELGRNAWVEFDGLSIKKVIVDPLIVTGETWLEWAGDPMPYDPGEIYEVQINAKRDSGGGVIWAGVLGLAADKTTIVGYDGTADWQKVHWVGASGLNPAVATRKQINGYFTGRATPGTQLGANNPEAPGALHPNVAWIKPAIRLNAQGSGTMRLLGFRIHRSHAVDRGKNGVYGKINTNQVNVTGEHLLTIGESLMQIGDQRNLPPIKAINLGFKYTGGVTVSAGTTSATVTIGAGQFLMGAITISYSGATPVISKGAGETQVTYHFYGSDQFYGGGSIAITATKSETAPYGSDNNVYFGSVTWTWPASGTVAETGYSGGGGCVVSSMVVPTLDGPKVAKDLRPGDIILTLSEDLEREEWVEVERTVISMEPCFAWTSESGVRLLFSVSTPLSLQDGSVVMPDRYAGEPLPVKDQSGFRWEPGELAPAGFQEVSRVSCGGRTYAAGFTADEVVFTHNISANYVKP